MQKSLVAVILSFSSIFFSGQVYGQDPVPLRQFYFNPYLFNPSFNASSGFTEVSIVHRRQWLNINDAPTTSGINVQIPTRSRVSLGFNVLSQEVIGLRNSSLMATFGYAIPVAESQFLRFGLSGGIGMNDLNLKEGEYDPNDETIINALTNNYYANGNFGVSYTNKGFSLGFSLPQLFKVPYATSGELSADKFSPTDYQVISASYKISPGMGKLTVEPYVVYRNTSVVGLESVDFAALFSYRDFLTLGGSYNTTLGPGFFFGLKLKGFKFGYSFEVPPSGNNFVNTSSHEIQLTAHFGEQRLPAFAGKAKSAEPTVEEPEEADAVAHDQPADQEPEDNTRIAEAAPEERSVAEKLRDEQAVEEGVTRSGDVARTEVPAPDAVIEPGTQPEPEPEASPQPASPPKSFGLTTGHYVVAGVFRVMQNAIGLAQTLVLKGYTDATVAVHPENDLYYVYVFSSYSLEEARKMRNQTRIKRPLNDAWILTIGNP